MFHHLTSKMKVKGKRKQSEGSSSSLQAQSNMSASLFAVIVSFHFIFIYTCSYQFIVMFYVTCLMFLLAGHSGLSAVIGAASWGAAWHGGGSRGAGDSDGGGGEGSNGGGGEGSNGGGGGCMKLGRPAAVGQL
jgi:uncharacterized membrane protein YgcG